MECREKSIANKKRKSNVEETIDSNNKYDKVRFTFRFGPSMLFISPKPINASQKKMKLSSSLPLSSSSTTSPPSSPFKKSDPSSSPTTSSRFSYSFLHKQCVKRLKASFTPLRRNSQQKVEINDNENLDTINNNHSENTRNVINQSNRTNNNKNDNNTNNRDINNKENVFINKINRIIELLPKIFFVILISNIYQFSTAIQDAVDIKVTEYSQEMIQAMTKCSKSYLQNKCMPNERVPALEQACSQWERCMNRDPHTLARVTASAETFGEIINSLMEKLSYKSMIVIVTLIIIVLVTRAFFAPLRTSQRSQLLLSLSHLPLLQKQQQSLNSIPHIIHNDINSN